MEREPKHTEPLEERLIEERQRTKDLGSLSSLEVENERAIPPVEFAAKSGCGKCG